MISKTKTLVNKVKKAVKEKMTPLLEQPLQVRELVFIQGLNDLTTKTGVTLAFATRDTKDLGVQTPKDLQEVAIP